MASAAANPAPPKPTASAAAGTIERALVVAVPGLAPPPLGPGLAASGPRADMVGTSTPTAFGHH